MWCALFATIFYHIREERNARRHGTLATSVDARFRRIKEEVLVRAKAAVARAPTGAGRSFVQALQ